jgi:hypothetical protein
MMVDQSAEYPAFAAKDSAPGKTRFLKFWVGLSGDEKLVLAILALALCARFAARPFAPFWLDEAATGAIISQPNFQLFWKEVYWEVSSPLYFIFMRSWQAVFGLSDFSLRAPSLLFSVASPLCVLFAAIPNISRLDKICWAALLALWIPGIGFAQDARCYAFVLFLSTLQTLAYIRLLETPSMRNSAIWVFFSAMAIASHYDAAYLALFQGLFFVGFKPREAMRCLPTGIIMIPTVAAILWQWPEMARFMHPDTTWYDTLTKFAALEATFYLLGDTWWLLFMPPLLIAAIILGRKFPIGTKVEKTIVLTSLASVLGAAALIALAMYHPILTPRYLAPFVPGVLLFLIVIMHMIARGAARTLIISLPLCSMIILTLWLASGAPHEDSVVDDLNYEAASNAIIQSGARHVVFAWDNPNARTMHPEQIKEFGSFFFKRAGYSADVIPLQIGKNDDPNKLLPDAARPTHAAMIWIYDTSVRGTAARRFSPDISRLSAGSNCQNSKKDTYGVVVCLPIDRKPPGADS